MMLDSRWNTNMDARRSISLLIGVAGLAVAALGMAASPALPAFGGNYGGVIGPVLWAAVGPVFGAATAGYVLHRDSDRERAPLWALAYGATAAVILVATFGIAAMIRPTGRGIPGLGDAWYGVIVSGLLVSFVGAFLWKRVDGGRRFAALGLLGLFLLLGWVISATSGDWGAASQDFPLSASGVAFLAFAVSRPTSDKDAATSAT